MTRSPINPQSAIRNPQSERLWRVRKEHAWIDARLGDCAASGGVDLQFFYDGQLVLSTRWPTRDAAIGDADVKLHDLQRVGWTTHW
ncbi:MAG TPA: hypothetical protein VGY57_14980 [Vicinamibacterales bacterium]|nr:hypothetical protein [Vicinamibacterales bacterium]